MSRAQATDPLHSFRFHAKLVEGQPGYTGNLNGDQIGDAEAGFTTLTAPEVTLEHAEYREGNRTYTEKYPGIPTMNDITLTRGVARRETAFFEWLLAAIEGREYRGDLLIMQFPRFDRGGRVGAASPGLELPEGYENLSKRYLLYNASPSRVKLAGDMDATTSDVSVAELDVVFERPDVLAPTT